MNEHVTPHRDYRFLTGLMVGSVLGAGLTMLLAPRAAAEIKEHAAGSAKNLGNAVSEHYRDARLRAAGAVDGLARKGRWVRESVSEAVVRGAQEVERHATDAKAPKAV